MNQNKQNTALLIMDMQAMMLASLPTAGGVLNNAARAIAHARENGIPVIYVVVGFRQGMPEVSPNNKGFSAAKERLGNVDMNEWVKIHPDVAPQGDEITVVKRRVSAFAGNDLEILLRSKGINHLVLTGFSTSGVVLSTIREAADKDYGLTVLADCCGDPDEEAHNVLIAKIFNRQAEVMNVNEWVK